MAAPATATPGWPRTESASSSPTPGNHPPNARRPALPETPAGTLGTQRVGPCLAWPNLFFAGGNLEIHCLSSYSWLQNPGKRLCYAVFQAGLAQLVEQWNHNPRVIGPSPMPGTILQAPVVYASATGAFFVSCRGRASSRSQGPFWGGFFLPHGGKEGSPGHGRTVVLCGRRRVLPGGYAVFMKSRIIFWFDCWGNSTR